MMRVSLGIEKSRTSRSFNAVPGRGQPPHFRQAFAASCDQGQHRCAIEAKRHLCLVGRMRHVDHMAVGPSEAEAGDRRVRPRK